MKKIILFICIYAVLFFASCASGDGYDYDYDSDDPDVILSNILKSYRDNGMSSWWEVVAVYNAGENPLDYNGFDYVYNSLSQTLATNTNMASYVIVANIALAIGADEMYFSNYRDYKSKLKELLENPTDGYTLNDYIFGYLALKTSGTEFNEMPFFNLLIESQKPDGGFALTGGTGDVDMTAFALQAMQLLYTDAAFQSASPGDVLRFLESSISGNGTFSSFGSENSSSTAVALSALDAEDYRQKAFGGLMLFKAAGYPGFSHLQGGRPDSLSTAQAAIALSDFKNNSTVWVKLYLDSKNLINQNA
jgi:hypothetical protein